MSVKFIDELHDKVEYRDTDLVSFLKYTDQLKPSNNIIFSFERLTREYLLLVKYWARETKSTVFIHTPDKLSLFQSKLKKIKFVKYNEREIYDMPIQKSTMTSFK